MARLFDEAIFSCNVGYAKPNPKIYQICLDALSTTADMAVFVGDGGSNELQGAQEMGLTSIMITGIISELWPDRIPERKKHANYVIERLVELIQY
jgi:putative hydrolase of the HAD superfamily